MKVNEAEKGVITIANFLTKEECDEFIKKGELAGFETATVETEKGARFIEEVRNNQRVLYQDEVLACSLWERACRVTPLQIGNSVAVGLNELFRFYKYSPGQKFKKHVDESFIRSDEEASYYTFMIYLNDEYEGGETTFDSVQVKGEKGMCLIFLHSLIHEGSEVKKGVKYILRSDIMYKLKAE